MDKTFIFILKYFQTLEMRESYAYLAVDAMIWILLRGMNFCTTICGMDVRYEKLPEGTLKEIQTIHLVQASFLSTLEDNLIDDVVICLRFMRPLSTFPMRTKSMLLNKN